VPLDTAPGVSSRYARKPGYAAVDLVTRPPLCNGDPVNSTLVLGLAGIIGTLLGGIGGPLLLAKQTARNERAARIWDMKLALYQEATVWAQVRSAVLDRLVDPDSTGGGTLPEIEHPDAISARMVHLAAEPVQLAWKALIDDNATLAYNLSENNSYDEHGVFRSLPTDPDVIRMREAIARLSAATRADLL
jgi:hypothetical protein